MTTWKSFLSWKMRTLFLIRAKSLLWGDSCTLMTTWRSFLSWKLKTPFLITAKSLLWGYSHWWPPEGAKGAYMTAKMTHLDDHLNEFLSWKLRTFSWSQPSLYSEVTQLDDQLKELKELIWRPSFYAKMTHLDDHLKKFLVLKAEDSLLDQIQASTLRWRKTWWPTEEAYMTAKFLRQDDPPWWPTQLKEFLVLKAEDSLLDHSQVSTLRWLTLMTTWRSFLSWKLKTPCWPTEKACLGNCMVNSLVETRRHGFWSMTFYACFFCLLMTILLKV